VWAHKIDTKLVAGILLCWDCGRTERMSLEFLGDWLTGLEFWYPMRSAGS
jgi:hypothetical protein